MKAVRVHQCGGPEVLTYEDMPVPEPKAGEARVKIEASGVNYIDIYQRCGLYPLPTPFTPGTEGAGIVDAVEPGVTEVKKGDRVAYAMIPGSYAEYVVVPAARLVPVPPNIDTRSAAALMLQGMTAHYLTHSTYALKKGDTALIHAAAGGVGLLLVQIAKQRGATVIGTVSTEAKASLAKGSGRRPFDLIHPKRLSRRGQEIHRGPRSGRRLRLGWTDDVRQELGLPETPGLHGAVRPVERPGFTFRSGKTRGERLAIPDAAEPAALHVGSSRAYCSVPTTCSTGPLREN